MAWLDATKEEAAGAAAIAGVRRYELRPRSRFQVPGYFSRLALREPVAVHLLWHAAPGEGSRELVELRFSRPVDPEAAQLVAAQVGLVAWRPASAGAPLLTVVSVAQRDSIDALAEAARAFDPGVEVRRQAVGLERVVE